MNMIKLVAKILLCGDGAVGKTALRERYLGGSFSPTYLMTIGADFAVKEINLTVDDEEYSIKGSIWDLAGQVNFQHVRALYYKGAHAMIMVYDTTTRASFVNIDKWIAEITSKGTNLTDLAVVLIGNKIDIREDIPEHISTAEGEQKAKELSEQFCSGRTVYFLETSAKTGENVEEAFATMGKRFVEMRNAE